jgi:MFS family permease
VTDTVAARLDSGAGWVQAGAAALSMFATFGVVYSFGAFFESMSDDFDTGRGATAVVFALTISLSFLLAPVTGRAADRRGPRPVLLVGAAFLFVGLLATAATPSLVLGYVTYGVGVGTALACGYVPMVANVGGWFVRRRTAALGVAVAGIGLGTLVANPVAATLIDATTWRTTFVIFAVAGTALVLVAASVVRVGPAVAPAAALRPLRELLRRRDFALLYVSAGLVTLALFVPFVFLPGYAEDRGASEVAAAALVGVIGGASVVGRLGLGAVAVRLGAIRVYMASFGLMAASNLLWLVAGDSYAVMVAYAVALGFGYGGFIAIAPAVVADRFGLEGLGGVLGTLYTSAAIGALIGPPLAGVVIDTAGYATAIVSAVVVSALGTATLFPLVAEARATRPSGRRVSR